MKCVFFGGEVSYLEDRAEGGKPFVVEDNHRDSGDNPSGSGSKCNLCWCLFFSLCLHSAARECLMVYAFAKRTSTNNSVLFRRRSYQPTSFHNSGSSLCGDNLKTIGATLVRFFLACLFCSLYFILFSTETNTNSNAILPTTPASVPWRCRPDV